MTFSLYDIVVVPFPFSNRDAAKRRPALVVSCDAFNRTHDQVILAMITAAARSHWASDVPVTKLNEAGLRVPCVVRLKLFTLDRSLVIKTLGRLIDPDVAVVSRALATHLGRGGA